MKNGECSFSGSSARIVLSVCKALNLSAVWNKGYMIVEEKTGIGSSKWGLKSGAGWIALDYTVKR